MEIERTFRLNDINVFSLRFLFNSSFHSYKATYNTQRWGHRLQDIQFDSKISQKEHFQNGSLTTHRHRHTNHTKHTIDYGLISVGCYKSEKFSKHMRKLDNIYSSNYLADSSSNIQSSGLEDRLN